MTGNSLLDLKAVSKPASKLIDSISSAVGMVYEPTRIRRKALADAEASLIAAEAAAKVRLVGARSDARVRDFEMEQLGSVEDRAINRLISGEYRRQSNVESIVRGAVAQLPATVSDQPVDEDWVFNFFDQCANVSDAEMQLLWARLLAGEVESPGTFSLRTLSVVKLLRRTDAELFSRFLTARWNQEGSPIIVQSEELISHEETTHLESIGLAEFNVSTGYAIPGPEARISYHGKDFTIRPKGIFQEERNQITIDICRLSSVGRELASIVHVEPDWDYMARALSDLEVVSK